MTEKNPFGPKCHGCVFFFVVVAATVNTVNTVSTAPAASSSQEGTNKSYYNIMVGLDGVTKGGEGGLDMGLSCCKHCYLRRF